MVPRLLGRHPAVRRKPLNLESRMWMGSFWEATWDGDVRFGEEDHGRCCSRQGGVNCHNSHVGKVEV